MPYFPCGFTKFGDQRVVAGLRRDNTVYLAVWCIGGDRRIEIPVGVSGADYVYPPLPNGRLFVSDEKTVIELDREKTAAFIKLEIKE